ncbi:MAG: YgjV family protein [Treponema sp.]|nr:YgjV family protein [Treponema sp.]
MLIEILGIVASLFVISAFLFKDIKIIRILDGIGALLYVIYGVLIQSYANILLNVVLVLVQVYHLTKLRKSEQVHSLNKE